MWCRLPGTGEFFSRGLDHVLTGSTDWASFETPFLLKKGEAPDLIRLNLVVEGSGRVWIRDIELLATLHHPKADPALPRTNAIGTGYQPPSSYRQTTTCQTTWSFGPAACAHE
jgi:hypothetical protein